MDGLLELMVSYGVVCRCSSGVEMMDYLLTKSNLFILVYNILPTLKDNIY